MSSHHPPAPTVTDTSTTEPTSTPPPPGPSPSTPAISASAPASTQTTTQTTQTHPTPLPALPAPPPHGSDGQDKEDTTIVRVDGAPVVLDKLGPMVVARDGTVSRIANWPEMTSFERENTLRVLGKRNQLRLANLRAGRDADDKSGSSTPSGTSGGEGGNGAGTA